MSLTLGDGLNQGLTTAQLAVLKADIAANTTQITYTPEIGSSITVQIKLADSSGDAANAIAKWYNLPCTVDFFANYSTVPIADIKGAIAHKNFTPTDAVPTDTALNANIHMARTLFAQAFQISVNNMLTGGSLTFDATNKTLVSSLSDATNTNMPTGASGANQKGGWGGATGVSTKLCRKATNLEKLFADVSGGANADGSTNLKAATMVVEGGTGVTGVTIQNARNS